MRNPFRFGTDFCFYQPFLLWIRYEFKSSVEMKKKFLLLIIALTGGGLYSCLKKGEAKEIPVVLCSFDISLLDNTFSSPQLATGDTVPAKAFGMRLSMNYVDEMNFCKTNPLETFSLFPSCYAVGPVKTSYVYIPVNKIDSVYIFSNNDFDANHPAGSNLVDYFSVFKPYSFYEVSNHLEGWRRIEFQDEYLYPKREKIDVLMMKTPENAGIHQFTIRFITDQGEVFEQTTSLIHLSL